MISEIIVDYIQNAVHNPSGDEIINFGVANGYSKKQIAGAVGAIRRYGKAEISSVAKIKVKFDDKEKTKKINFFKAV